MEMALTEDQQLSITLLGKEIPIQRRFVSHQDLRYDPKNPRVYSIVRAEYGDGEPDQDELEAILQKMEHVKQLIQAIRANGGLTDPVLVRGSEMVVVEGNSRLAACRALAKADPVTWAKIKCDIVPGDISEEHVLALLIQYHIVGRKDWDPFEQAGLFWRRCQDGADPKRIVSEMENMGLSARRVQQMIHVYSFMVEHNDTRPNRWSYYEEMLKSRSIVKAMEEHPQLPALIVQKVKSGEIARAIDIRTKVDKIARVGGRTLVDFIEKKRPLEKSYQTAISKGVNNTIYNRLKKFRELIAVPETKAEFDDMPETQANKCVMEMKRIKSALTRLIDHVDG